jgi:hypothetical protein
VIPPYTEADWQRDWEAGAKLSCPRCGSDEDYAARQAVQPDRTFRRYRACKRCGMFQEADGTKAYQTFMMVHECDGNVGADAQCRGCGLRIRNGGKHRCPRIVREGETFTCPECATTLSHRHILPWPEQGPWAS